VLCPGKIANALPDAKTSTPIGSNGQRETHLHMIRRRCLDCAATSREVTFCTTWDCVLHPFRFGVRPTTFGNRLASEYSLNSKKAGGERHWKPEQPLIRKQPTRSPLKSIRQHCLWCSGTSAGVAECSSGNCPLHLLRFGKDPRRKKPKLSAEQRTEFLERIGSGSRDAML
ncbi:MAG: hypothetical protein GY761_12265, partial [Hyphomicrobiales bacterium]|nr:hypothetical protein [Hyphomicrobiales bacterium]